MENSSSKAYEQSGVDITSGYKAVELMQKYVQATLLDGAKIDKGGYGLFELPSNYTHPVLVSGTDGVGTKLKLAFILEKYDTVGIDCVAMCVNDILRLGARPIIFLDYIACGKNQPEVVANLVKGVSKGCIDSYASLVGGETAEMPGFYKEGEYDLAGFSVGIVEKDKKVQKEDRQEEEEKEPEKIENTTGAIPIEEEVDMKTMVTDLDSLGEKLEKAGKIKGADEKNGKLGIVESSDLKNLRDEDGKQLEGHSSRYKAVVITDKTGKDGKPIVRALDLETDSQEGTNPVGKNYQVKQNKDIEKEDVQTRLEVQGDETIGIKEGKYGEKEIYYSKNKTLGGEGVEGNRSLDIQLETEESKNSIGGTDQEIQKLSQEYQDGYRSVEDSYQEAKIHENSQGEPCEEMEPEDIDGDPNTSTHNHIDETVEQLMKNEKISDKFTEREVREMVERAWDKKDNEETLEEFKERMEDTVELDAENMRGR